MLSTTQHTHTGNKTNVGKKGDKNKASKEKSSSSKCKSSPKVLSSNISLNNTVAPHVLQLDTTSANIKDANCSTSVSPSTASVNVICVVSSEPNNTSVLSGGSRSLATSFPLHIDNQCKDMQSANFIPSEPLNLVHPPDTRTVVTYSDSHQNAKSEYYELVANPDTTEENSKKNSLEQTSCIILSNVAKCSFPMCDSNDESLLLFKVDDDSYVVLCTHHSLTNLDIDAVKEGTSTKEITSVNISEHVLDNLSDHNHTAEKETTDTLAQKVVTTAAIISENTTHCQNSSEPCGIPSPGGSSLVQLMSQSAATTPEVCVTSMPVSQQLECMKPSTEVCLTEHLSTMMELDSGIASPSVPIVDESFSLAQMEVHCLLCEEQFLCMDDYVTHLETCHN